MVLSPGRSRSGHEADRIDEGQYEQWRIVELVEAWPGYHIDKPLKLRALHIYFCPEYHLETA